MPRRSLTPLLLLLAAVTGLAGCGDYVLVTLRLQRGVSYTGLGLDKLVGGTTVERGERLFDKALSSDDGHAHEVDVAFPGDANEFVLRVQAFNSENVVAQGEVTLARGRSSDTVEIGKCASPLPKKSNLPCVPDPGPSVIDGGMTPDADAGRDDASGDVLLTDGAADASGDVAEVLADRPTVPDGGSDAWMPAAACRPGVDSTATPLVDVPEQVSKECERYCASMAANCSQVFLKLYVDDGRCKYACKTLNWPLTPATGDTLMCRAIWAGMKGNEVVPDQNCTKASPNSAEACGTACEVYCRTGNVICGPDYFPRESDCLKACSRLRKQVTEVNGDPLFYGNHLKCRLDFLQGAVLNRDLCSWAAPNITCGECPRLNLDL